MNQKGVLNWLRFHINVTISHHQSLYTTMKHVEKRKRTKVAADSVREMRCHVISNMSRFGKLCLANNRT